MNKNQNRKVNAGAIIVVSAMWIGIAVFGAMQIVGAKEPNVCSIKHVFQTNRPNKGPSTGVNCPNTVDPLWTDGQCPGGLPNSTIQECKTTLTPMPITVTTSRTAANSNNTAICVPDTTFNTMVAVAVVGFPTCVQPEDTVPE